MRKIIVLEFITLDGIIQGPGGPDEDTSNGFKYGGWTATYNDEESGRMMAKQLERADLLLGRKTFEIWENHWPQHGEYWPGINEVTKYVLSTTRDSTKWNNCRFLKTVDDIKALKNLDGEDIKLWGSSEVVQLLLQHDLVDEFWLNIHPVMLGKGKRLFDDSSVPSAFEIVDSMVTSSGVVMANYKKSGAVKTGNAGPK